MTVSLSRRARMFAPGDFSLGERVCSVSDPAIVGTVIYLGPGPALEKLDDGTIRKLQPFTEETWRRLDDFLLARDIVWRGYRSQHPKRWSTQRFLGQDGVIVLRSIHSEGTSRLSSPRPMSIRRSL